MEQFLSMLAEVSLAMAVVIAVITSVVITFAMLFFGRLILGLFISGDPGGVEASLNIAFHYLSIMAVCLPILFIFLRRTCRTLHRAAFPPPRRP